MLGFPVGVNTTPESNSQPSELLAVKFALSCALAVQEATKQRNNTLIFLNLNATIHCLIDFS
jgi:hypothetical protein